MNETEDFLFLIRNHSCFLNHTNIHLALIILSLFLIQIHMYPMWEGFYLSSSCYL